MSRVSGEFGTWAAGLYRLVLLFACVSAASGCTSMQALERGSAARSIEPGDTVFVSTRDGRELELVFDAWSSDGLTGTDEAGILQRIANDDIERVEVKRLSVWKNIALGAAIISLAALAASDDILDAFEDLFETDE